MTNLVEVVVQQRTAALERPLTYRVPPGLELGVGDVVRVPLGPRELYGFVVAGPRLGEPPPNVRAVLARASEIPAFDAAGLALAQWIAEHYCCSLSEALGPMIYGAALGFGTSPFTQLSTAGTSNDNLYYTGNPGQAYNQAVGLGYPNLTALAARF